MGMFSTPDDVRNALTPGGVSNDRSTAASLPDSQVIDAIGEADATIILHIRVAVPDETPAIVRVWSRDIAAYMLHLTLNRNKPIDENDPVRLRYNAVMQQLVDVRDGVSSLPFTPGGANTGDSSPAVINQYAGTLFHPADFRLTHSYQSRHPDFWPGR